MNQDNGGIIGKINTPTTTVASGVWTLQDQFESQSSSIWPLAFPQATFTNSLRIPRDDSSPHKLDRTPSSASDRRTWTWSGWIKRTILGAQSNDIFNAYDSGGFWERFYFNSSNVLEYDHDISGSDYTLQSTMLFRDTSAWYHLVVAKDTTQSTEADRVKIYVNGSQIALTEVALGYPTQNYEGYINTQTPHTLGSLNNDSNYDGYMTQVVFVDGQQLTPTSFGAFNPVTNIWEPIPYAGTYGTNGFKLNFADSSNLGDDTSGNGNDFTANNLTSIDQSTDTCSNNFAALNPLVTLSGGTLSEGNLKYNYGSNGWRSSFSTIGANKGKWYCEVKFDSGTNLVVGIVDEDGYSRNSGNFLADSTFNYSHGYGYFAGDGHGNSTGKDGQGTDVTYGDTFAAGDIIGIAMDLDNGKLYFSKNGTFQNSGVPTSGSTGTGSVYNITNSTTLNYFFGVSPYNATASLNTGSPSFSISSGNADANGHGNFEYAVPSGYFALNTKNLAEFG